GHELGLADRAVHPRRRLGRAGPDHRLPDLPDPDGPQPGLARPGHRSGPAPGPGADALDRLGPVPADQQPAGPGRRLLLLRLDERPSGAAVRRGKPALGHLYGHGILSPRLGPAVRRFANAETGLDRLTDFTGSRIT